MTSNPFINQKRMLSLLATAFLAISASAQGAVVLRIQGEEESPTISSRDGELCGNLDSAESSGAMPNELAPNKDKLENRFAGGGASSNTTTSSSGGSSAGSSSASLNPSACAASDLNLVGWIGGEARFALPDPPGSELLKPPQA